MARTEPTIAELNKKVDERHEEVSARLEQLSVGMNEIRQLILSRQHDEEEHSSHRSQPYKGNRHDGPPPHYATHISKIDFPRFDGKKMKEWLYKCDQFFALDATSDDSRVRLASIHLEGPALQWNNAREQNCRYHTMASQSNPQSIHDFTVKDAKGNDVNLGDYKGKVLLIVNVASQCGLTNSNYTELTQLYDKYKSKGLEILAFPCNQFGGQEPGSLEEIQNTVCTRFKAEFPIFDKVDVNGSDAAPIYKYLKSSKGGLFGDGIKWNFAKFLVDKNGNVVDRYAPTTSPLSIEKDLVKLLAA